MELVSLSDSTRYMLMDIFFKVLKSSDEPAQFAAETVKCLKENIGCKIITLYHLGENGMIYDTTSPKRMEKLMKSFEIKKIINQVVSEDKSFFVSEKKEPDFYKIIENTGVKNGFFHPLKIKGKIIGVIALMGFYENKNINEIFRIVKDISLFASIFLDASYKYEQLEKAVDDKKFELQYLAIHDQLTNLFNRKYFNHLMTEIDRKNLINTGIIIMDINGLKIINDTLGHNAGDRFLKITSDIIKKTIPKGSNACRIGGDEFSLIVYYTNEEELQATVNQLEDEFVKVKEFTIPVSVSCGYAIKKYDDESAESIFIKADNSMYKKKLMSSRSRKASTISTIEDIIKGKDYFAEGHPQRVMKIMKIFAEYLLIDQKEVENWELLGKYHDLGKVGISDEILFKAEKLSKDEWDTMKKHCEIGFRIAQISPELHPIAEWILYHHEKYDGTGYPIGLKSENIPLASRALSIADSFDAMTSLRPYQNRKKPSEAKEELKKCSGTQFDPELVDLFIKRIFKRI